MKPRWHLLFLSIAVAVTILTAYLLDTSIWQIEDPRLVSFDRYDAKHNEWSVLVGSLDKSDWSIEKRSCRDAKVIQRVILELPSVHARNPYCSVNAALPRNCSSSAVICNEFVGFYSSKTGPVEYLRIFILDSASGKLIRTFNLSDGIVPNSPAGQITAHGEKVALIEKEKIILLDTGTRLERSLNSAFPKCLAFSPDGSQLAYVDRSLHKLFFIDWDQGVAIQPEMPECWVVSFCFVANDTLLVSYCNPESRGLPKFARWRKNGVNMTQITPGIPLLIEQHVPYAKIVAGALHVKVSEIHEWPVHYRSFFNWLAEKKIPIEDWFPKQSWQRWYVLNDQDQIVSGYDKRNGQRNEIYDHLSVEFELRAQGTIIRLWNEHPVWPNALAAGLILYLFLYVLRRCVAT